MGTHSHRCLGQILMMVSAVVLLASPALAQGIYSGTVTDDEGNPFEGATIVAERPEGTRRGSRPRPRPTASSR